MTEELRAHSKNFGIEVDRLLDMNTILREDINSLISAYDENWDDPTFRRMLVRSCWAYVEAISFGLKRATLKVVDLASDNISAEDRKFLSEKALFGHPEGPIEIRNAYPDTKKNIKRTFKIAVEKFELEGKPEFSGEIWEHFLESLEIRHRITHPKLPAELTISDEEMVKHRDSFLWFSSIFNDFLQELGNKHGPNKA